MNIVINPSENTVRDAFSQVEMTRTPFTTYHELSDDHVVEADVLETFQKNLLHLKDLSARMNFMMGEITGSLKL